MTTQNEPMSALTHAFGALLAVAGLILLIVIASIHGSALHVVTYTIFGVSMILLYTMSTLYHFVCKTRTVLKHIFRILDHSAVYVLIAGTYTPVALVALPSGWGWSMFGCIWLLAVFGIIIKTTNIHIPAWVSLALYLLMGWLIVIAGIPLKASLPEGAFFWLVIGGILYSCGAVFFALDSKIPRSRWFGMHEVFHLFVLCGTFSHFWMLYEHLTYIH